MKLSRQTLQWAARIGLGRRAMIVFAMAAVASGVATYAAMTGVPPFGGSPARVLFLLNLDLVLLLVVGAMVARRLVGVWAQRRRGLAGSRLHIRLVRGFILIAVAPTILVALSSYASFSVGIESWFSERVRTALTESRAVAEAYLHEHQQIIRADVLAMAADLNREAYLLSVDQERLGQVVSAQAALRSLTEVIVFDRSSRILARSGFTFGLEYGLVPDWALKQAGQGDVAIITSDNDDRVRALVRLDQFPADTYLYVGRFVEPQVLNHMEQTQRAVAQYELLEGRRSDVQIGFAMVFLVAALLILGGAVWFGLNFATQLARPISALVTVAERIRSGDLAARAAEGEGDDEFGSLSRAFNRMTSQIEAQQRELIEANRQLDERRRFSEAVLAGVSAGVIGLDASGRINLPNRSASVLLATELDLLIGHRLAEVVPEMAELIETALQRPDRRTQSQLQVTRGGRNCVLLVRIVADRKPADLNRGSDEDIRGVIVTFDDVTELISAQRKAAWADVARRIAHEIKNPLTPIQLSAERLRRKYLKEIQSDPETFSICTDTIVRHVEDIGRMVDEFSSFARMPAPVIRGENLVEICRNALFLQRTARSDIAFELVAPEGGIALSCDARMVGQALVNLLKNAVESIEAREGAAASLPRGKVVLRLIDEGGHIICAVEDNGRGLPERERDRLTEPYVTTRAKGTGLGLAIVRKIMEEHGGELLLEDREGGGARVKLVFPGWGEGRVTGAVWERTDSGKLAAQGS
jgi:two-component system, NtrC family, nitrogen regulation sensor histidine kinase NtrY